MSHWTNSLYMHNVHVNFRFSLSCSFPKWMSPRRLCRKLQRFPSSTPLWILGSPAQAPAVAVPDNSNQFELLHTRQSKQIKPTFIQHCRRPIQFPNSPRRPSLEYKMASQEWPLHTTHPPTTIHHSSSLTQRNDLNGRAAATNTSRGAFDAYRFGLKLVRVSSPKALAPSPFHSSQKSCRSRLVKASGRPAREIVSCLVYSEGHELGSCD
jgi:hypothetical protein